MTNEEKKKVYEMNHSMLEEERILRGKLIDYSMRKLEQDAYRIPKDKLDKFINVDLISIVDKYIEDTKSFDDMIGRHISNLIDENRDYLRIVHGAPREVRERLNERNFANYIGDKSPYDIYFAILDVREYLDKRLNNNCQVNDEIDRQINYLHYLILREQTNT